MRNNSPDNSIYGGVKLQIAIAPDFGTLAGLSRGKALLRLDRPPDKGNKMEQGFNVGQCFKIELDVCLDVLRGVYNDFQTDCFLKFNTFSGLIRLDVIRPMKNVFYSKQTREQFWDLILFNEKKKHVAIVGFFSFFIHV